MTYQTISGDSWDLISCKVLGSERYAPDLIEANLDYVDVFIFDAGIELTIPQVQSVKQSLLPWKD